LIFLNKYNIFKKDVRDSIILKIFKKLVILRKKYNIEKEYVSFDKEMVSRAIFIGFFIAFIPMPMQMMFVFLVSPFVRFNIPIAFLICWITNPLTMPFIYYIEYSIGAYILGIEVVEDITFSIDTITSILKPLYYGAFVLSTSFGSLFYYLSRYFWK